MRKIYSLALLALLMAPPATEAADLTISIDGIVEYDDNALRQGGGAEDDVLFRFRPQVRLHEDRGQDVRYSLQYAVPFEFAAENGDELDDIDHDARGRITYHVNDRLELYASDKFRYLRSALSETTIEDVIGGEGNLLINEERDRTTLNEAEVGARYRFTPRLSGGARISHEYFDSERDDRAENWLLSGAGDLSYVLTPKHTVGFGGRVLHQEFDDRTNIPGSVVDSYNVFGQWTFRIDETLSFSMSAGPTYIDSDQDDPDTSQTVATIPFSTVPVGAALNTSVLVDENGGPVPGVVTNPDSIVVSQVGACPIIVSTGQQVFNEDGLCGFSTTNPGIFLDGVADAGVIADVMTQIPIMDMAAEGQDDTRLDFFAEATIAKHWTENLHSALRYQRTQGGASGLGGAVIRDTVTLSNTWDFAERWQFALRSEWTLRQSVVDDGVAQFTRAEDVGPNGLATVGGFTNVSPAGATELLTIKGGGSSEIDTMRYGAAGRLTHKFSRNTSGWVQLTYNQQESDSNTLGKSSDFENFLAVLGVRHVFDPVKLW